jgi:hypothetical protein
LAKHRPLQFDTFVKAVPPDLLERYFGSLSADSAPSGWASLNGAELEKFLSQPENGELDGLIRQDFRRINDMASKGVAILLSAYERFDVPFDHSRTPEHLGLALFLDHPQAWDFAWSRYLLFALDSKVSVYAFPHSELGFGEERVTAFRQGVSHSLVNQAKGAQCDVRTFEHDAHRIIYVRRGYYIRPITFWEGEQVEIRCFRPVLEDVIALEVETGDLVVKAAQEREREDYVRLFAHHFAGDMSLGEQALRTKTFDLSPEAEGTFSYAGEGLVLGVELVGIKIQLPFKRRATLQLNSSDVFETLEELPTLALDMGVLVAARFRFRIGGGKKVQSVTFEVAPPSRTDLPESTSTNLINSYLRRQGVRLR